MLIHFTEALPAARALWMLLLCCVVLYNAATFPQSHTPAEWRCTAATYDSTKWPPTITECTAVRCPTTGSLGQFHWLWLFWVMMIHLNCTKKVLLFLFTHHRIKRIILWCDLTVYLNLCRPAVPPGKPTCRIPTSVMTNKEATLTCYDSTGSPPPTYRWYRDNTPLPVDPKKTAGFQNSTYTLNPTTGMLVSYTSLFCTSLLWHMCLLKKKKKTHNFGFCLSAEISKGRQGRSRWILLWGFKRSWSTSEMWSCENGSP